MITYISDQFRPAAVDDGEKIEAVRICLRRTARTTAVLSEFRTADPGGR